MEFFNFLWLTGTITYQKLPQRTTDPLDPRISHHHTLCFFELGSPKQPKKGKCKGMKYFFSKIKIAYFIIIFLIKKFRI